MTLDLLSEALIQSDVGWHSLPGLLSAMTRGEVGGFPSLRPHQRPAWHMFLVQLSVLALGARGQRGLLSDEEGWREALQALTMAFPKGEPWHLIGSDPARPAFLQPPVPDGMLPMAQWPKIQTPDALDMLITARNHDVKREIARHACPQDWIYALVSLQTMEGFGGSGNYGIARMNGGSSSRVLLGLAPARAGNGGIDPSAWWARDVGILLEARKGVSGKALLWQEPWPEGSSLELSSLDPLFIEVCRRVRLTATKGQIEGLRSTSQMARIAAKEAKGNTGDPWAPVHLKAGKSLTLGEQDWTHELLAGILFKTPEDWSVPYLAQRHARAANGPMLLVAEAFARGNSKTNGFKSRIIPVPDDVVRHLFGKRAKTIASTLLSEVSQIDLAMRKGLVAFAASGTREKVSASRNARTQPARDALRRHANHLFFPELWKRLAITSEESLARSRSAFLDRLARIARDEFARALPTMSCTSLMRPRAEARGLEALEKALSQALAETEMESVNA